METCQHIYIYIKCLVFLAFFTMKQVNTCLLNAKSVFFIQLEDAHSKLIKHLRLTKTGPWPLYIYNLFQFT